jgi:hypothetical protein
MDQFLVLRFAHLVGLMLTSAGLIGVFVADMRSRQVRDVKLFAQAVTFIAGPMPSSFNPACRANALPSWR